MLPHNLRMLDDVVTEIRRLRMLTPPLRGDVWHAVEKVELARAAARVSGHAELASELAAVTACLDAAWRRPEHAATLLREAGSHLAAICSDMVLAE